MSYKIAIMKGDGIGPEISQVAESVINTIAKKNNIEIIIQHVQGGDSSLSKNGIALPEETISLIKESDACLKGPVGESAMDVIVKLRQMFDLYVNLRPIINLPNIKSIETGMFTPPGRFIFYFCLESPKQRSLGGFEKWIPHPKQEAHYACKLAGMPRG